MWPLSPRPATRQPALWAIFTGFFIPRIPPEFRANIAMANWPTITRSQTFTKEQRGETQVRQSFSAVADDGEIKLSLTYMQGGIAGLEHGRKTEPSALCSQGPQYRALVSGGPGYQHSSQRSAQNERRLRDKPEGARRAVGCVRWK